MEYYPAILKNKLLQATAWVTLTNTMLNKRSQISYSIYITFKTQKKFICDVKSLRLLSAQWLPFGKKGW